MVTWSSPVSGFIGCWDPDESGRPHDVAGSGWRWPSEPWDGSLPAGQDPAGSASWNSWETRVTPMSSSPWAAGVGDCEWGAWRGCWWGRWGGLPEPEPLVAAREECGRLLEQPAWACEALRAASAAREARVSAANR